MVVVMPLDDLGHQIDVSRAPSRIVSLVPSLTEALALTVPDRLVGATDWCTQPAGLDVARVRGTKNPDIEAVLALRPDLVVANEEENRLVDLDLLRAAGLTVWVTDIRTVDGALSSMTRLFDALGANDVGWLEQARHAWAEPLRVAPIRLRAVVPIWRRPWMFVGRDTYAGDVLRRLGVDNVLADHAERYPAIPIENLPAHDLVVLPDEPYAFSATDGPEAFERPCALVDGRFLTWYGPAMVEAPRALFYQLRAAS
uniref:ABC-type Fe3+-hydroxamate transport system, periplasmic component n=1 Tax=uncultured Nocardioidaceae bacterium TaxID=253824 RepID=A0A6J4KW90_9ACTN|nr:MAG: ABC-type Fe3+-hydroxamate transport system, periplasmic component [uncultured Nocardioidaceae bacterium]